MLQIQSLFDTVDRSHLRVNEVVKLLKISRVTYHKWRKVPGRKPHEVFLGRANLLVDRANELVNEGRLPLQVKLGPKERWGILKVMFPELTDR